MSKEIKLCKSPKSKYYNMYVTKVDDEDYEWLNQYSWHICHDKQTPDLLYVKTNIRDPITNKFKSYRMNRMIMQKHFPEGYIKGIHIDHINSKDPLNTFNNQVSNLRYATCQQNMWNRPPSKNSKTGYKGVTIIKRKGGKIEYKASVKKDGKEYSSLHDTAIGAAKAYDVMAIDLCEGYAYLNDIKD